MITNQSNLMNNSMNGGMVVGINNNLTLINQSPNISNSNGTIPNSNSNNQSNPSVMTYNPTYNKCLPKILSDLDCEMRVKQVLKCVESMLAEGADEASINAHTVPHNTNSPNSAQGFSSFKLSSNSLNINSGINSNSNNINNSNNNNNNIISDRQVPGASTPQKKLKRSDYSETTPKLLESSPLIPNQTTPNISSLSNGNTSSPRKSSTNGNSGSNSTNGSSSPKHKIKINIGRIDDQRQSNNNSPIQGQPSNSPIIKQSNLDVVDKKQQLSNSVQQSPLISQQQIQHQQQIDDQRRTYQNFYSPQLGMQMMNQQGQVITIQGTPVINPQQQNNMQSPPMMPFSIEDPRRTMMYAYDQNGMIIQNPDHARRHSFAPYGVTQIDPNAMIDQQRRMSYSTFESQQQAQQQQNMMHQIHMAQIYQQQIQQQHVQQQPQQQQQLQQQQQPQQLQQQQQQQQKQKSPTMGNVNSKNDQYEQQSQPMSECKKEDKIDIQQENRNQQNQQFCLNTPTLSAYPAGVQPVNNEEDSWILSFFSEEAQDNPEQLKSNQG